MNSGHAAGWMQGVRATGIVPAVAAIEPEGVGIVPGVAESRPEGVGIVPGVAESQPEGVGIVPGVAESRPEGVGTVRGVAESRPEGVGIVRGVAESRPEGVGIVPGVAESRPEGVGIVPGVAAIEPERMNSPLETREVRLRGLPQPGRGVCTAARGRQSAHADFVCLLQRIYSPGWGVAALLVLLLSIIPVRAAGQATSSRAADSVGVVGMRVEPDTVTVGDRFRAAVFVRAPAGSTVTLTVPAAADGAYQPIGEARTYPPDSAGIHRAVATLVLWVTDPAANARADVRVTPPTGAARTIPIQLPLPAVRSVLPADSAQPRPPKDIIETPRREWTREWSAAGILTALMLLAYWIWRRRRRPSTAPPADPRQHALAELDRLRASGLLEADVEAFAAETSAILRAFAARADPRLGADLTTSELLDRLLETGARAGDVDALERALAQADLAKFARRPPPRERALQDWEAARRWIEAFQQPASAAPELAEAGR